MRGVRIFLAMVVLVGLAQSALAQTGHVLGDPMLEWSLQAQVKGRADRSSLVAHVLGQASQYPIDEVWRKKWWAMVL